MSKRKTRILVAHRIPGTIDVIVEMITGKNFKVVQTVDPDNIEHLILRHNPKFIIIDLDNFEETDTMQIIDDIKNIPNPPIIIHICHAHHKSAIYKEEVDAINTVTTQSSVKKNGIWYCPYSKEDIIEIINKELALSN